MMPTFKKKMLQVLQYGILILVCLIVFIPIIGIFFSAFKTGQEYYTTLRIAPPESFLYFDNFIKIFKEGKILTGFYNTFVIMAFSLVLATMLSTMVAFVLDRFEFRGKSFIKASYLVASFVPGITTQIIVFNVIKSMGLINSLGAPVILYIGVDVVSMYIYLQFMKEIPRALDEAAMIEGSSYFGIYHRIIIPMLSPAIVTTCIIKGTAIYNDFYTAFLYLPAANKAVMSTMLFRFMGPFSSNWNVIAAGVLVVILPIFIVFISLQKYIYKGFAEGAVK